MASSLSVISISLFMQANCLKEHMGESTVVAMVAVVRGVVVVMVVVVVVNAQPRESGASSRRSSSNRARSGRSWEEG